MNDISTRMAKGPGHDVFGHAVLWATAILLFVIGDIVTTQYGLANGAVELHPIAPTDPLMMFALKLTIVGLGATFYHVLPRYEIGIPLGLTFVGAVTTGWNIGVIV